MKVDPIKGTIKGAGAAKRREVKQGGGPSFGDVLDQAASHKDTELGRLFDEIDESGRMLRDSPNLDSFKHYRERVVRFVRMFLAEAYDVQLTSEITLTGRQRHLVLVKKVDEKLEELYHLFLQEMLDIEELLKGVEEVRGMLLDLYK